MAARDQAMAEARESANAWRAARGKPTMPAIEAYADHVTPLVLVAMNTGMRRGELTSLTWSDVHLPGKRLTVRAETSKAGKARHLPLNSEAVAVLERWAKCTPYDGDRVFPIESPKKAWAALIDDAKISDLRFHDLRHHFASRLVMAGIDLNTVRDLLGHADIKMTLRYAHLAPEHKASAVETLVRR
jgi:integrase